MKMAPKRKNPVNKRLRELRERLGLSQTEMAEKFRVSFRTYQRFENTPHLTGPESIVLEMLERQETEPNR